MGKIKGWRRAKEKDFFSGYGMVYHWISDDGRIIQISKYPPVGWDVTLIDKDGYAKVLKIFNTYKDAYFFAINWMKKHP